MAPISVKTENCPHREHTSHPTIQDSYYLTAVNELCIYLPQSYSNPHTTQQSNQGRKQRPQVGKYQKAKAQTHENWNQERKALIL